VEGHENQLPDRFDDGVIAIAALAVGIIEWVVYAVIPD
jgi:hypothetical protein